ncbi:MAG TPA: nucleotidyltransferase family protein [Patescibacteria group bacterium]|nr:nucleotidyltransferase family protein [Patescibacteria group bacterium]
MSRIRLTITLEPGVLRLLDTIVDRKKIRNRSHAIEYILNTSLQSRASRALILSAGTNQSDWPKDAASQPVLWPVLKKMAGSGIKEVVIIHGQKETEVETMMDEVGDLGLKLIYLRQKNPGEGTARAIFEARQFFSQQPFLLWYGDVQAEIDLDDLSACHLKEGKIATMALTTVREPGGWGAVDLRGSNIVGLQEKPGKCYQGSCVVNAGVYILEPTIFDQIKRGDKSLEKEVLPRIIAQKKLAGYMFEGYWHDWGKKN